MSNKVEHLKYLEPPHLKSEFRDKLRRKDRDDLRDELKIQPEPEQEPESELKPEPEQEPESEPESELKPEPEQEPEPESEVKPEPKPEPESKSEPESKPESKSEPELNPGLKPEPEPEPKPESNPETKSESKISLSMLKSISESEKNTIIDFIITNSNSETVKRIEKIISTKNKNLENKKIETKTDETNSTTIIDKLKSHVKPIDSLINQDMWVQQEEKTNKLQHQHDSHRSFLFDHTLGFFNMNCKRSECVIGKIDNVNYYNFIKGGRDITNEYEFKCNCTSYKETIKCSVCSKLKNNIASKSYGIRYTEEGIPRWNSTFSAGALRSKDRVHFGTFNVRAKTRLFANCVSFITFSMIEPINDPIHPNSGYCDEISLGFFSKEKKNVFLFIKTKDSVTKKEKSVRIPILIEDSKFKRSNYNNYKLKWEFNNISLFVNGKNVYKTERNQPVPKLPGYTYFSVRPNYNTNNNELLKKIKTKQEPNIRIKSFTYTPM